MNKMLLIAVFSALLVAGCSDKDDAVSGKIEPSMLEKAKESTREAMSDIKGAAIEAKDSASRMASEAKDSASRMASEAKTAVTAKMGDVSDMASDTTEAVADMTDGADEAEMDDGGVVGQQVYQRSCQSCHAMGVAGAPKLSDKAAWAPRIATGMDALLASSINGKGIMPPRGACASCSDDDLRAAVQYMVSQSR